MLRPGKKAFVGRWSQNSPCWNVVLVVRGVLMSFFVGNYGGKIVLIASVGNLDIVPSGAVV